jgi:hypothetical protein
MKPVVLQFFDTNSPLYLVVVLKAVSKDKAFTILINNLYLCIEKCCLEEHIFFSSLLLLSFKIHVKLVGWPDCMLGQVSLN